MNTKIMQTMDLTVGYDRKTVIAGIDLEIGRGQMVALLGPNGAGKSTLLKTASSLLKPVRGSVHLKGQLLSKISSQLLSKTLAVVLTERLDGGFLTAYEVAAMGRYPHTGFLGKLTAVDRKKVWACLSTVNAEPLAHRLFNELSDGEKQKILLARALAQEPELIILDEPTTHLDIRHKMEIMAILKRLSREEGIAVLFSLHEIDLALKNCDTAVLVKNGQVVFSGAPEALCDSDCIAELFDIGLSGYDAVSGTLEMTNTHSSTVFVVGGGGKAAGLFRTLTRHNIGFSTGVLHENDIDYHVAKAIGVKTVSEKAFSMISDKALRQASDLMKESEVIVDTGFPVSVTNHSNHSLILEALKAGRPVCVLRSAEESKRLYGELGASAMVCGSALDVAEICGEKAI